MVNLPEKVSGSESVTEGEISTEINRLLTPKHKIQQIYLRFISSRIFIFEMYFKGYAKIEHNILITEEDDDDLMESFFSDVESSLEHQFGSIIISHSHDAADNIYIFDFTTTHHFAFNEDEVSGYLTLTDHHLMKEEICEQWIDYNESELQRLISTVQSEVEELCQILPGNVIEHGANFVDKMDEIFDFEETYCLD
ncbi:MAG: hypothetical protein HQL78_07810 [Magnetococcales bacterium]|nr:hypothetical protein [Magnetococcales bacterium]